MEYDFSQFLKDSQEQCKSRDEFIERISNEIKMVVEIPSDASSYLDRKAYLRRLEWSEFEAKTSQFKEPDKFDDELRNLLESLS